MASSMGVEDENVSSSGRARRLLALAPMLDDVPLRAADAAETLGVTVRTIYRDIDALRAAGFAIEGDPGIGYMLAAQPSSGPLALTKDERRALIVGAKLVKAGGDAVLAKAATSLLKKAQGK
jgi:predicted DNA-binding transcriptional regulator YafY